VESTSVQLRQPKLAEIVADVVRQRILTGELADGELLPTQDIFVNEFGVSRPSMREALRILEAEGLITVRRGNVGGAVVHRPESRHAAYTLALVLQSRGVALDDVGAALQQLEGACAGLCAKRKDRKKAVVKVLEECNKRAEAALDAPLDYVRATADFHRSLAECSGNETMRLLVGSIESLWLTHVQSWAEATTEAGGFPDRDYRAKGLRVHRELTELIAAGDVAGATTLAQSHFDPAQFYLTPADGNRRVDSSALAAGASAATDGQGRN
jgi:GntR family transcriptional repressor for pyruvate dehydrogenase complex